MARTPLADDVGRGSYKAPIGLIEDFREKADEYRSGWGSKFLRIWMRVVVDLPVQTLRLLWALADNDEVQASQVALRWFAWGAEREIASGNTPSDFEGEIALPDPQARESAEAASLLAEENSKAVNQLKETTSQLQENQQKQGSLLNAIAAKLGVPTDTQDDDS